MGEELNMCEKCQHNTATGVVTVDNGSCETFYLLCGPCANKVKHFIEH